MSYLTYSLYIDETGDTEAPGESAVVGLLVEGDVLPEADRRIRAAIQSDCVDLAWAIHAAALNTPAGFLKDRKDKPTVVHARLEDDARALEKARLRPADLRAWTLSSIPESDPLSAKAKRLASAVSRGRSAAGIGLASLPTRAGGAVGLVATVCGPGTFKPIETVVADGYVRALVRTFRTVAELVAPNEGHAVVHVRLLERDIQRAGKPGTERLGPTVTLRLAEYAVRRATLQERVSFGGAPKTYSWNQHTSAMLVLADHAANRFGHALKLSGSDDEVAFLSRLHDEIGVSARSPSGQHVHGLAHLHRTATSAPLWAQRLPAERDE